MLYDLSQTEKDKYHMISLMEPKTNKKTKLIDTENRLVVARVGGWGVGKMGDGGQKV